jgi:tetratricopeptide (TPR) repeat protein
MIEPVEWAMSIATVRGTEIKEQWYLLLRVAYWELNNLPKVKDILEILVVRWPKKEYWTNLSAVYAELDMESRQLAAYEAAYDQGLLVSNGELVQMAQLFLQAEVPYKAAMVLDKGMTGRNVEKTAKNYRLMSQAWALAQEDSKAIPPLREAARLSDDGELDARLAQSYLNLSRYKECIQASNTGLRKGDVKRADDAYMVLGMCHFESDNLGQAETAFKRAQNRARNDRSKKNANSWLRFIQNERSRVEQLQQQLDSMRQAGA